jgi:hypothetical protein
MLSILIGNVVPATFVHKIKGLPHFESHEAQTLAGP